MTEIGAYDAKTHLPKLLERVGMQLKDLELIEMNEAFAAQVIANERAFASKAFAQEFLQRGDFRLQLSGLPVVQPAGGDQNHHQNAGQKSSDHKTRKNTRINQEFFN